MKAADFIPAVEQAREPVLAPPGAGLPWIEWMIARVLFRVRRWTGTCRSFTDHLLRERELVRALVRGCDPAAGAQRVLIRRPAGLEDSSRYWSVWMTLDHLRIVHEAMAGVIEALGRGVMPPGEASTAAVKPSPGAGAEVVAAFEQSCDTLLAAAAAVPDLNTRLRYPHPWFGPLTAAGWYALAGVHLGLHRVQVQRILEGRRGQPTGPA